MTLQNNDGATKIEELSNGELVDLALSQNVAGGTSDECGWVEACGSDLCNPENGGDCYHNYCYIFFCVPTEPV